MRYVQISFFDVDYKENLKSKVKNAIETVWKAVKEITTTLTIDTTVKISRGWEYQEIRF